MLSGQNHGSTGCTDRVSDEGPVKNHALLGKAVDVGCLVTVRSVGGNCLVSVIIGENEKDVQRFGDQHSLTGQGKYDEEKR